MDHFTLPRLRMASWARVAAVAVAVLLVCWLVIARSTSAFSSQTQNEDNLLSTGSVKLTGGQSGSAAGGALFYLEDMAPGQTVSGCAVITYEGTVAPSKLGDVRLHGTAGTATLAPYLDMVIERSALGGSCGGFSPEATISTGTLQAFMAARTSYANALPTGWTPSAKNQSRAFRFTVTLRDEAGAQGGEARPTFIWEIQTTP